MSRLGGQFAGILRVQISSEKEAALVLGGGKPGFTPTSMVVWRATADSEVRKNTRPSDTTRLRPSITGAASAVIGALALVGSPPPSRKSRRMVSNTVPLWFSS